MGTFEVVLIEAGPSKLNIVRLVKKIMGWNIAECKDLVENAPNCIKICDSKVEEIKKAIEECGGTALIKCGDVIITNNIQIEELDKNDNIENFADFE